MNDSEQPTTSKRKRLTTFNDGWCQLPEYSKWLRKKNETTAECIWCLTEVFIKYEGCRSLNKHMQTQRHIHIQNSRSMTMAISKFAVSNGTTKETAIAIAELMLVYHNVMHSLSYSSLDCQVKWLSKIFPDSNMSVTISLGRTKAAAITINIIAPFAQNQLVSELKNTPYFSISCDASTVGNVKTYPYAVQYFNELNGIEKKILDFYEDCSEKSEDIYLKLMDITAKNNLNINQISAYSADNASVKYGIHNSVYQILKTTNNNIIRLTATAML
ncbi:uncharacterized protein LOC142219654 [Haematobia irritans]|uniref:uncharacterized protein LOC142219654 n=1 Tax=Haematobia irritans TaxID=7368 RepID=UPI003F4F97D9